MTQNREVKVICPHCKGTGYPCRGAPKIYIPPAFCKGKGYILAQLIEHKNFMLGLMILSSLLTIKTGLGL